MWYDKEKVLIFKKQHNERRSDTVMMNDYKDSVGKILESIPAIYAKRMKTLPTGYNAEVAIFQNATAADFEAYCNAFAEAGYAEYSKTSFCGNPMENGGTESYYKAYFDATFDDNFNHDNFFATYVSDDCSIDIGFHEFDNFLSVAISPCEGLTLPLTSEPAYTPVDSEKYPVILTQVGTYSYHPSEIAACHILRLADGSFIVYDTSFTYFDDRKVAEEIYAVLRKQAPDPENIVISAIVLSHPHLDHMGGFVEFADLYGADPTITVKQVVYNFPDLTVVPNERGAGNSENLHVTNTNAAVKKLGPNVEVVKPRSGNVLCYPGVKFRVLYTHEDFLTLTSNCDGMGNATSLVMQMVTNDGTTVLFGGDHWTDKTKGQLKYRYGTFLESFACTLFHHGIGGGAESGLHENCSIYAMAIKPKIVLWPATWRRMNQTGSTNTLHFSDSAWNRFLTAGKNPGDGAPGTGGFEADKLHDTPNKNGVYGWFLADDGIQVFTFCGKDRVSVEKYATREAYYNS